MLVRSGRCVCKGKLGLIQVKDSYKVNIERKANHKKKVINFELDKDKTFF